MTFLNIKSQIDHSFYFLKLSAPLLPSLASLEGVRMEQNTGIYEAGYVVVRGKFDVTLLL